MARKAKGRARETGGGRRKMPPPDPVVTPGDVASAQLEATFMSQGAEGAEPAPEPPPAALPPSTPMASPPAWGSSPTPPPPAWASSPLPTGTPQAADEARWIAEAIASPKAPPIADFAVAAPMKPAPMAAPTPAAKAADPLREFFYDPGEEGTFEVALPRGGAEPRVAELDETKREYLSFKLGGENYALEIERIREILKPLPITEVPRAQDHVLGVITLRGEVIPIFDLRRRVHVPPAEPGKGTRIVICDLGPGPCGIIVDEVTQVIRLPPSAIEPRPQGVGGIGADYLMGIGRQNGRLFILLDLPAVLRRDPIGPKAVPREAS
jgi:purine-binding chemotaxis protein CheW